MPPATNESALESRRAATVDQLILNYGHGKLSLGAFERRLDAAFEAASADELAALTKDLEVIEAAEVPARRPDIVVPSDGTAPKDVEHMVHIFGGSNRGGAWAVPREIRMLNVFGGGELDFTDARFSSHRTRIRLFCLFGGATIYVPEGLNTFSKAICVFGGIDNRAPSSNDPEGPALIIEGFVMFGGASIKVKKTLKERLVEFADSLRQTFRAAH